MFVKTHDKKEAIKLIKSIKRHWDEELQKHKEAIYAIEEEGFVVMDGPEEHVDIEQVFRNAINEVNPELVLITEYDRSIKWDHKGVGLHSTLWVDEDYDVDWYEDEDEDWDEDEDEDWDEDEDLIGYDDPEELEVDIMEYYQAFLQDAWDEWKEYCEPLYNNAQHPFRDEWESYMIHFTDPVYGQKYPEWGKVLEQKK